MGLGTDIAGGYDISIMSAMRQAVAVSRMREGARILGKHDETEGKRKTPLSVDWKEALYLATTGGAQALGLGAGVFAAGRPFDAQCSESLSIVRCFLNQYINPNPIIPLQYELSMSAAGEVSALLTF